MPEPKAIRIAATAVLVVATVGLLYQAALAFSWLRFPPAPVVPLHEGLGQVLAEHALDLLRPGGRVLVMVRETTEFEAPATQIQLRSFRRVLQQAGQAPRLTRRIRTDPLRPVSAPAGDFFELLRRTQTADVVVSFLGPPDLDATQVAALGKERARVVALCTGTLPKRVDLRRLFTNDLLHVAILSRREASMPNAPPATPLAWFDRFYYVATSSNLTEVPVPAMASR